MKRKDRVKEYCIFYQKNYKTAMNYILCKTGDFLNAEDLLEKVFTKIYKYFMKEKTIDAEQTQLRLYAALREILSVYNKKQHRDGKKSSAVISDVAADKLLEKQFYLSSEIFDQKMILHDILAFVSKKPKAVRRAFTYRVYYGMSIAEAAKELDLSEAQVEKELSSLLAEVNELFLEEYEQEEGNA